MTTHRYSVRKIHLMPLAKFGFSLGALAMLLPGLLCAGVSTAGVVVLRDWLETWQNTSQIDLGLVQLPTFDFISLLGLSQTQAFLTRLSDQRMVVALLILLVSLIGGGLLVGLTILLVGWGYNMLAALTGGLEIELREERKAF
jgi:hypothetical protein